MNTRDSGDKPKETSERKLGREEIDQLGDDIARAAAHIDAATHRLLTDIRRFDECKGWCKQGARSCAHWLSYRIGLGLNAAREKVRVARRLGQLPLIDEALRLGSLSFSKVRAMTRVATPENEERLVRYARCATGAQLERICRGYRQVTEGRKRRRDDGRRYLRRRHTADGMVRIEAQLRPDEAALVMQALGEMRRAARGQAAQEDGPAEDGLRSEQGAVEGVTAVTSSATGATGRGATGPPLAASSDVTAVTSANIGSASGPEPDPEAAPDLPQATLADGLVLMAETALAQGPAARRAGERNQLIVQLGPEQLDTGEQGSWRAELQDGTWLAGQAFQRFACDCAVTVVTTGKDGAPLDVGRKQRSIPPSLWTALLTRAGGGCEFPGCSSRIFLQAHHIEHWSLGGPTNLDNLVVVCTCCHDRLHEGGFRVERAADGTLRFFRPDGELIDPCPTPPEIGGDGLSLVMAANEAREIAIDCRTSLPHNYTPRFDLGAVVQSLLPNQGRL